MLIVAKRRFKRQHVVGGSGIFDTVVGFIKRIFTSDAAKDLGKTLAVNAGKRIIEKAFAPPSHVNAALTQKSKDELERLIAEKAVEETPNLNNLIMTGRGKAIAIQDYVRKLTDRE